MIVVDTNILAHFWLPSDSTDLCDKLYQKDPQWVAPILWQNECRNVVALYLRKELMDLADFADYRKGETSNEKPPISGEFCTSSSTCQPINLPLL